jgi:hypothetical protein
MRTKTIKLALTISILVVGANASDIKNNGISSIKIGVSKATYNNNKIGNSKLYMALDIFTPINSIKNLYIGLGADFVGIDGYFSSTESYGNYTLGGQLKVGYSLKELINYNTNLKAYYGYGVTRYKSTNNWGMQYGASLDTEIAYGFGVGYEYKHVNMGISDTSYNTNIFFIEKIF